MRNLLILVLLFIGCTSSITKDKKETLKVFTDQDTLWRIDNINGRNIHIKDPVDYLKVKDIKTGKQMINNPIIGKEYIVEIYLDSINERPLIIQPKGNVQVRKMVNGKYALLFKDTSNCFLKFSIDCSTLPAYQLLRTFSDSVKFDRTLLTNNDLVPICAIQFKPQ